MADTYVDFTTNLGDIDIQLFDDDAPQTVQDFLNYAENTTVGDGYTDSFFHRLVAGFVLQGGGYDVDNGEVNEITTGASVQNEYSNSHPNVAGTVALAKLGNDPNSGTDQFFINLSDNSSNLDSQDGGFTVFGQVTPGTYQTVLNIANLPVVNAGSPFDELPVENYTSATPVTVNNLVVITAVSVIQGAACYCKGTLILTAQGEVPVEVLAIGDNVITASGEHRPVKWIGRRTYTGHFVRGRRDILPICIHAGALGNGLPHRDLHISPLHAMLLDGVLVPAGCLVNGVSITQPATADTIHYVHVELETHDVLLAEGSPSESFVDDNSRGMFQNVHEHSTLFPDHKRVPASYCALRVENGEALDRIKRVIDVRAGLTVPGVGEPLRGHVDGWEGSALHGWAQNPDRLDVPVCLEVLVDGVAAIRTVANRYRADLQAAGLGNGCHGFHVELPASAVGGAIEVRRIVDGTVVGAMAEGVAMAA